MNEPAVTIRRARANNRLGYWMWRCNNPNCGWVGLALHTQPAALREACRHLVDAFDQHHGMVEVRPAWNEDRQRATATCHCGHEVEEPTEQGAEDSLDLHAQWLREELAQQQAADDNGPSVREAAVNDRRWDLEKAGE